MNTLKKIKNNNSNIESLVIILHGWGANAADLIGLADEWMDALPNTLFIAPDAPEICDANPFGFQWFSLGDWSPETMTRGAGKAHEKLDDFIQDQMKKYNIPANRVVLMGFSQGMMMALYTGLRQQEPLAGILGYSGALIGEESLSDKTYPKLPLCLIHGLADNVVPYSLHEQAVGWLKNNNYDVEILAVPGLPHGIDETGLEKGQEFLVRCLK